MGTENMIKPSWSIPRFDGIDPGLGDPTGIANDPDWSKPEGK